VKEREAAEAGGTLEATPTSNGDDEKES